jgi:hypothetical protein
MRSSTADSVDVERGDDSTAGVGCLFMAYLPTQTRETSRAGAAGLRVVSISRRMQHGPSPVAADARGSLWMPAAGMPELGTTE